MKLGKGRLGKLIFLIVILILIVFPLYWSLNIAFQVSEEIPKITFYPHKFTWIHFERLFGSPWSDAIINSLQISLSNVALVLLVSFPAAYGFTRYRFKADKHVFFWFIINRLAPPAVFIVPFFVLFNIMGLLDTVIAVIIAHCLFNIPLAIWILTGFMQDIDTEIDEAAYIDGHSRIQFFRRILIPQMKPALGITAFLVWLFSWTEVVLASAVTQNEAIPLTVQLMLTKANMMFGEMFGEAAAAGIVSMIPGLILLYFVKDYLAEGFTFGRL